MMVVWKFRVEPRAEVWHWPALPKGAQFLSVQVQMREPVAWFLVEENAGRERVGEERKFMVVGTGFKFDETNVKHLGTFQLEEGRLVFHLFEVFGK